MKTINIINEIKNLLIGKKLKISIQVRNIKQDTVVRFIKNGVTNKQETLLDYQNADHLEKYTKLVDITKSIGKHTVYDIGTIVDVCFDDSDILLTMNMSNDITRQHSFDLSKKLIEVDKNIYILS